MACSALIVRPVPLLIEVPPLAPGLDQLDNQLQALGHDRTGGRLDRAVRQVVEAIDDVTLSGCYPVG
jgi:hypothetical protein